MNEEGAHILVGIVSKRLGKNCSQQDYYVSTSVSALLPWIEASIKENGGMASCGFNFSASPILGFLHIPLIHVRLTFSQSIPKRIGSIINKKKQDNKHYIQEPHRSLYLRLVFSFLEVNQQKDNSPPLRLSDLKIAKFLLYQRLVTVLGHSSLPRSHHSLQYVGGGGWENHTPQTASHSM